MHYHIEQFIPIDFYTEGPCTGPSGELFVTTLTGTHILRIDNNGATTIWSTGNCPNGQLITPSGQHLVCETLLGKIALFDTDGSFVTYCIENQCGGEIVHTPNDLVLDQQGNLYFTDSIQVTGKLFYKGNDGTEKCLAKDINYANGVALNKNETCLYVAESYSNRIRVYPLLAPGVIDPNYAVFQLPAHSSGNAIDNLPDGLCVDSEDRIWVAHYGMQALQVLQADGTLIGTIDTTIPLTSNVAIIAETSTTKQLLVTGGFGEPGPGAVAIIHVTFP
jgi:gluconolactonase